MDSSDSSDSSDGQSINTDPSSLNEAPNKVIKSHYTWSLMRTAAADLRRFADQQSLAFYMGPDFIRFISNETCRSITIEDQPNHLNVIYFNNRNERVGAKSVIKNSWLFATDAQIRNMVRNFFAAMTESKAERNHLQPLCEEKCCSHLSSVNLMILPWTLAERRIFDQIALESTSKGLLCERFIAYV